MFKGVIKFWERRSFASRMTISFLSISIMPLLMLFYINFSYNQSTMDKKIIDFAKANLRQAAQNINNTLNGLCCHYYNSCADNIPYFAKISCVRSYFRLSKGISRKGA